MLSLYTSASYPDSQLYVLSTVHLHAFIQQSDLLEVAPVHHEATNQSRTPDKTMKTCRIQIHAGCHVVQGNTSPHRELRKNVIIHEKHHRVNAIVSTSECLPEKDNLISTKERKSIILPALMLPQVCRETKTIKIQFVKHTNYS